MQGIRGIFHRMGKVFPDSFRRKERNTRSPIMSIRRAWLGSNELGRISPKSVARLLNS